MEGIFHKPVDETNIRYLRWHQTYLPAFLRVVATDEVVIYARKGAQSFPFVRLRSEDWSRLNVTDWHNGSAIDEDGVRYYSIHASIKSGLKRGRKSKLDWDGRVKRHVHEFVKSNFSDPSSRKRGWKAKVERDALQFIQNEFDESPSESVARDRISRMISELLRSKAGN